MTRKKIVNLLSIKTFKAVHNETKSFQLKAKMTMSQLHQHFESTDSVFQEPFESKTCGIAAIKLADKYVLDLLQINIF